MDYKELLEDRDFKSQEEIWEWMDKAATAITKLITIAEVAEARAKRAERERDKAAQCIADRCTYYESTKYSDYCGIDNKPKPCDKCIGVWRG